MLTKNLLMEKKLTVNNNKGKFNGNKEGKN